MIKKSIKIKILLFADGNSIHTFNWLKGFCLNPAFDIYIINMNPEGIKSEIISFSNVKMAITVAPNKININGGNLIYLLYLPLIFFLFRKIKPDIINAHYLTSYGFIAALLRGKSKLVLSLHGTDILVTPKKSLLAKCLSKFALKRSHLISSVSQQMTNTISLILKDGISQIITQQYGIDNNIVDDTDINNLISRPYNIISTRRIDKNSQIDRIIDAHKLVRKKVKLIIYGSGPCIGELENNIHNNQTIAYFGYAKHDTIINKLRESRIYISMTLSDGTSLSLLEALACGCYPIVSDIPANQEWINNYENGRLVSFNPQDIASSIEETIDNNSLLQKAAKFNRELVKRKCSFEKNMNIINNSLINLL